MTADIIIRAEGLGKMYVIGHKAERVRYVALRDVLTKSAGDLYRKTRNLLRGKPLIVGDELEEFWALRDINFEVKRGEVVGIIGRNGAGKSTLLKIMSRITDPSAGRVSIKGRVSSLLEVGTGFHPELTGRENIYVSGAILGMTRADIGRQFDEIVAFAEVERHLDTPVKRYSSGMYVRLAFAIAAHLQPDIMIVDEVLAVGDLEFQKKCLGKMQDVSLQEGRTVLFVSHNMAAIESMCVKSVLLSGGRCVMQGETHRVVEEYIRDLNRAGSTSLPNRKDRSGTGDLRFTAVHLEGTNSVSVPAFRCGAPATLHFVLENCTDRNLRNILMLIGIDDEKGQRIALLDSEMTGSKITNLAPGRNDIRIVIPRFCLAPGQYRLDLFAEVNKVVADWVKTAASIDVEGGDFFGTGRLPPPGQGQFLIEHSFVVS